LTAHAWQGGCQGFCSRLNFKQSLITSCCCESRICHLVARPQHSIAPSPVLPVPNVPTCRGAAWWVCVSAQTCHLKKTRLCHLLASNPLGMHTCPCAAALPHLRRRQPCITTPPPFAPTAMAATFLVKIDR
jgi:hypothetical protein